MLFRPGSLAIFFGLAKSPAVFVSTTGMFLSLTSLAYILMLFDRQPNRSFLTLASFQNFFLGLLVLYFCLIHELSLSFYGAAIFFLLQAALLAVYLRGYRTDDWL